MRGEQKVESQLVLVQELLAVINGVRTTYRRPPFTESNLLSETALGWARYLATRRVLTHGNFAQRLHFVLPGSRGAETIGAGYAGVDDVVGAWMGDPAHRAILLGDYTIGGGAMVRDQKGTPYWVWDVAQPAVGAQERSPLVLLQAISSEKPRGISAQVVTCELEGEELV